MGIYRDKKTGDYKIRFWHQGTEYRKTAGKDKRSAELMLAEVKSELKIGKHAEQGWEFAKKLQKAQRPRTFAQAADDYMCERANYKASSIACYESILGRHLLPAFGKSALWSLTDSELKKFQVALSKEVAASRVNTIMQLLRSILEQEYRQGAITRNPSASLRREQESKPPIDPLSDEELEAALKAIKPHYQPLFTVLAYTGARPNEMLALRWSDIDWRGDYIHVTKGRVRGAEGLPKTKSAERKIPINARVKCALELLQGDSLRHKDDYVFTNPKGQPINKHLDRIWARALKKAGLRHRPSYQLRHTFATHCIIKGFPLPFIAKMLGHSTIDTLIRHYAGWIDSASAEQEQKLKAAFSGGTTDVVPVLALA